MVLRVSAGVARDTAALQSMAQPDTHILLFDDQGGPPQIDWSERCSSDETTNGPSEGGTNADFVCLHERQLHYQAVGLSSLRCSTPPAECSCEEREPFFATGWDVFQGPNLKRYRGHCVTAG